MEEEFNLQKIQVNQNFNSVSSDPLSSEIPHKGNFGAFQEKHRLDGNIDLGSLLGKCIAYTIIFIMYFFSQLGEIIKAAYFLSGRFLRSSWKTFVTLYLPVRDLSDSYCVKGLKYLCDVLQNIFYELSVSLYKYGRTKKYYKIVVGERKFSPVDIARMSSGIGEHEELTLKDIQQRFTIGYDIAIKVRDMRKDKLKMYELLKEAIK